MQCKNVRSTVMHVSPIPVSIRGTVVSGGELHCCVVKRLPFVYYSVDGLFRLQLQVLQYIYLFVVFGK
jgi:hypothetical protein